MTETKTAATDNLSTPRQPHIPPERKWWVFGVVWTLALAGFLSKILLKHRVEVVAHGNYILLGWVPALGMLDAIPFPGFEWMMLGGILYTSGAAFLLFDQRVPFFHATWHMFVLCASVCHFWVVLELTLRIAT